MRIFDILRITVFKVKHLIWIVLPNIALFDFIGEMQMASDIDIRIKWRQVKKWSTRHPQFRFFFSYENDA